MAAAEANACLLLGRNRGAHITLQDEMSVGCAGAQHLADFRVQDVSLGAVSEALQLALPVDCCFLRSQ
ncbi:hypothetical protein P7K49_009188 [Saguinus oedipus]|uniref:Uncharacterized protein n=1 Tax=Saguinus oedipus TaxID=9490 RepID=A0ABQ9VJB8_SAGOE|nr:hypothetical protein P7K49_009188 [Saguinus oedipus]